MKIDMYYKILAFLIIVILFIVRCKEENNKPKSIQSVEGETTSSDPIFPLQEIGLNYSEVKESMGIFANNEGEYWDKKGFLLARYNKNNKPYILIKFSNKIIKLYLTGVDQFDQGRSKEVYGNDTLTVVINASPRREKIKNHCAYDAKLLFIYKQKEYEKSVYGICDSSLLLGAPKIVSLKKDYEH
jgi:hypothetical protein